MYQAYKCNICKMTFIIPTEDLSMILKSGRYITCNIGHQNISELKKFEDLKDCMNHSVWKKEKGKVKQIK